MNYRRKFAYSSSFNVLRDAFKRLPNIEHREELDAALSHWLMDFGISSPPFWKKQNTVQALDILSQLHEARKNTKCVAESTQQLPLQLTFSDIPYPPPKKPLFTFIDLFAGIGGFRQAMQSINGKCVFSSEWDKYAQKTYFRNYGEFPYGDIRKISTESIPDHDVLCAGFPCQPFSLAGVSKKNSMGRKHGFEDETQGTLFFDIARILHGKRPKCFFLENVKNLLRHNKGETFEVIRHTLENELGYTINWKIVDAAKWVPQHRERLLIVGYNPKVFKGIKKDDIVIPQSPPKNYVYPSLKGIVKKTVDSKYTLGPGTWATLERHKANHKAKGNGFGYGLHEFPFKQNEVTRTISARYHKDGAEILIGTGGVRPRRLTVEEAQQLQGYDPASFRFPVSNTQAYRQIGNSVAVPVIKSVAEEILRILRTKL